MAKSKAEYWLTEDGLTLLGGWARSGLTDAQIAHNMDINISTLYDYKKKYPEINDTLKKNKEIVDYEVENALLKQALSGNTMAMMYWLNNRQPQRWRQNRKEEKENNTNDKKVVIVDDCEFIDDEDNQENIK